MKGVNDSNSRNLFAKVIKKRESFDDFPLKKIRPLSFFRRGTWVVTPLGSWVHFWGSLDKKRTSQRVSSSHF